jgi:hypothetical protein
LLRRITDVQEKTATERESNRAYGREGSKGEKCREGVSCVCNHTRLMSRMTHVHKYSSHTHTHTYIYTQVYILYVRTIRNPEDQQRRPKKEGSIGDDNCGDCLEGGW